MLKIDMKQVIKFENQLEKLNERGLPVATREAVNTAAWQHRKGYQSRMRDEFTLRNKWTEGSVFVNQAPRGLPTARQKSESGSMRRYMLDQEYGAIQRNPKGGSVPITTPAASNEAEGARPRRKVATCRNRRKNIQLNRAKVRAKSRKQQWVAAVQQAVQTGTRTFYFDHGRGRNPKGIFRVYGGSRRLKRGWPKGAKVKMLHNLSRPVNPIKPEPMVRPEAVKQGKRIHKYYAKALAYQLRRLGM